MVGKNDTFLGISEPLLNASWTREATVMTLFYLPQLWATSESFSPHIPLSFLHSSPATSSLETINQESCCNFPLLPALLPQSCWSRDKANLYYITEPTPLSVNHLGGSLPLLEPKAVNSVVFVWWVLLEKLRKKKKKEVSPYLLPRLNTGSGSGTSAAWLYPAV